MTESEGILRRIKKLESALDQIESLARELYKNLEAAIMREHNVAPMKTVVSNRFGKFLVSGVDNFSLEQELTEQPALVGHINSNTETKERVILPPWKILS